MTTSGSIEPQSPSPVAGKGVMQQELADVDVSDREATSDQRVISIGAPIPIVFCKEEDGRGGTWVSPPAGLYGATTNPRDGDKFAFGMVISDGRVGDIALTDIYKGASRLDKYPSHKAVFQYGGMPTAGFDFTLQNVVPGDPGVPPTPGYWVNDSGGSSDSFSLGSDSYWERSWSNILSISFNFNMHNGGVTQVIRVYVNGGQVYESADFSSSSPWTWSQGFGSRSNVRITFKSPRYGGSVGSYQRTLDASYTYQRWQDGDPGIPPTPDVTSDLPLFPGQAGTYAGMSCLSAAAQFKDDSGAYTYRQQVRCFVRNGMQVESVTSGATGSSNMFPDLAYFLLRKANPSGTALIDKASFQSACVFCKYHGMLFNGILAANVNLRDYLTRVSKLFLLGFIQEQGLYSLRPLLPTNADGSFYTGGTNPEHIFGKDQIVQGSLQRSYFDAGQRQPFCVLASWRSQRETVFGVTRTIEVRYAGTAPDGPFEQYDLTEFCALPNHAELVAKYILAFRKHVTHTVNFELATNVITLGPMDIIRVDVDVTTNAGDPYKDSTYYLVDAVQEGPDGSVSVEATHFPVNGSAQSLVALDIVNASFDINPNDN